MEAAWRDHQHARSQTWGALTIVAGLLAGAVAVDAKFGQDAAMITIVCAFAVILAGSVGIQLTFHHRNYERRKFFHIMQCEAELGLRKLDEQGNSTGGLLHWPENPEKQVRKLNWTDMLPLVKDPKTPGFIVQIYLYVMAFAVLLVWARLNS